MLFNIWYAVVVVLVIVLLWAVWRGLRIESTAAGMWVGTPDFLQRAGLSDMQLWFDDDGAGYLIMVDEEDNMIANGPVDVDLCDTTLSAASSAVRGGPIEGTITVEGAPENTLPESMMVKLDCEHGFMTLLDDEKIYAVLYKDMLASAV